MSEWSWAAVGAALGAFLTGLFAWLTQRSKGSTDIEVAVLAEWQKLNAALSARLTAVEKELAELRIRHAEEIEELRETHRAEMTVMREQNEGLQRQIAQNSQSTAHLIGDLKEGGNGK